MQPSVGPGQQGGDGPRIKVSTSPTFRGQEKEAGEGRRGSRGASIPVIASSGKLKAPPHCSASP